MVHLTFKHLKQLLPVPLLCILATTGISQIAEFEGTGRSTASLPEFQLYDNATGENRIEGRFKESGNSIFLESLYGDLRFTTGLSGSPSTRMTIDDGGNVGIGLINPIYKLHVKGNISRLESMSSSTKYIETRTDGSVLDLLAGGGALNIAAENNQPILLQGYGRTGNVYVRGNFGTTADFGVNGSAAVKNWFRVNGNSDGTAWRLGVNGQSIFRGFLRIAQVGATQNDGLSLSIPNNSSLWEIWHGGALRFAWANVERSFISTNGSYNVSSDLSKKRNIEPSTSQLQNIMNLNPVHYEYLNAEDDKIELGFIAQEVQKIFPSAVNKASDGTLGVAYDYFAVLAIKGIQEQENKIYELKKENQELQNQVKEIKELLLSLGSK